MSETFIPNFQGDIISPNHPDYPEAISRWAANATRKAKVVAFVKNEQDVVRALKSAKENKLPLAVRGGGHNPAGASSVVDGLVIDLSRYMNGVRVDQGKKLAYVGGGAVWETVDRECIKFGLASVAGTVNHTGVGGLALGGGYGWLTAEHGLVADNIVQATVVTAAGAVLTVNEIEYPDLYFAIRGGGGNFGVVTEFVLQLHPQRATVYSGLVIFPASAGQRLIEVTQEWLERRKEKESMFLFVTLGPDGDAVFVMVPFYNGSEAEGREHFKGLLDVGPVNDGSKGMPYEEVNGVLNPLTPHGHGEYMKGVAIKELRFPSIAKVHQRLAAIRAVGAGAVSGSVLYEFFGHEKVIGVTSEATSFRRERGITNVLILLHWSHGPSNDRTDEARGLAHELSALILEDQPAGMTRSERLGYSNYDPDAVKPLPEGVEATSIVDKARLVFGGHYPRLQAIKKVYDPENIFNRWFPLSEGSSARLEG